MAGGRWRMARVPVNERPVLDREEEDGRWKTKRKSADNVFGLIESDGEDNGSLICLNGRGRVGRPQLHRLFRCCRLRSLANGSPFDRRLARTSHFGRSGRKWSGRVWGSLANLSMMPHPRPLRSVWTKVVGPSVGSLANLSKVPSATTSVGLDKSGPAECGGHLRAIQRYHPRPLRSVWTKVVRPSVGVTCEQFKDTIRDHFGRSGQKWSGRVWGSLASNSKIPSATTSVGLDESGPAECGGHLRAIQRYHPRPLRSVWTKVVRPSVGDFTPMVNGGAPR